MSPPATADQSTKSKMDKKNLNKRKKQDERSNSSFLMAKNGIKKGEEKKKKKARFQKENNEAAKAEVDLDHSMSRVNRNKEKKHKREKNDGEEETGKKQRKDILITDVRFASAQLDPRFRRMPKREAKVPIDSRFARMLSDRSFSSSAALVDKRGKPRKGKEVNPLLHYYLHEKEPEEDADVESEQAEEETGEEVSTSSDGGTDTGSSTTDDENDEDDDHSVNSDICRYLMANHEDTPTVDQETYRLAIVNMDWDHIKAVDLYVVMSSCLPKSGQILSVTIYPSEFGLKCMEIEAVRGPTSLICDDEEPSEDEPDPEILNEKLRVYEMNKLRYYYAVAVFDSSATANHVYNTLDGTELTRTSNVFDLRFIPDSMEFKHPPRDVTTEAPTSYKEPDFQTRALQHCKVNLTWEDDEPQRVKTLRRKFNAEKLDDLNEYLASTDDSDDDHGNIEKLRALLDSNNNSDSDESKDDRDMEITFNTGLEDLSKRILEKRDTKIETAWERVLRRRSEKRKASQNRLKYSSDDDSSDYDVKEAPKLPDDFFVEDSLDVDSKTSNTKNKRSKDRTKHKEGIEHPQEIEKEQEASRAELELLFAEDQEIDKGPKGYNMKSKKIKGKKRKEAAAEEKLPNVDCSNDPRFAALYSNHLYALDPTDPQYKRSVAFARKQIEKQIGSKEEDLDDEVFGKHTLSGSNDIDVVKKPGAGLENEKHELSSIVRSLKRNLGNMKK
ncbi:pre-rRNA-processing protein esf1 [Phalaenopsis equestris]|uniref:pre-rRNA-processing protein esf1 n=1 Tax=Phalaenopsis equestris TaxID=78828 RepID=UPI0009E60E7E|nr:pre-rRNA-processing protein esf1 [Phalaenopsis equestris]XP_020582451.1 pre-rRNA-processing protein esf1 [Phalaenopsis equestris]